jgi:hypothetical protein
MLQVRIQIVPDRYTASRKDLVKSRPTFASDRCDWEPGEMSCKIENSDDTAMGPPKQSTSEETIWEGNLFLIMPSNCFNPAKYSDTTPRRSANQSANSPGERSTRKNSSRHVDKLVADLGITSTSPDWPFAGILYRMVVPANSACLGSAAVQHLGWNNQTKGAPSPS